MATTAADAAGILASGKILSARDGVVVFNPAGTNYELHLASATATGPVGVLVKAEIRAVARKVWTVPSGGNFIAPILGTPRTIQGRVRALDPKWMIVQAGTPVFVEFPPDDSAFEMANGVITVGAMVNVLAQPGARIDLK